MDGGVGTGGSVTRTVRADYTVDRQPERTWCMHAEKFRITEASETTTPRGFPLLLYVSVATASGEEYIKYMYSRPWWKKRENALYIIIRY
jgi:hypothetical protein